MKARQNGFGSRWSPVRSRPPRPAALSVFLCFPPVTPRHAFRSSRSPGETMRRFPGVIPLLCLAGAAAFSSARLAAQPILVGDELDYTVRRGDTLAGIGARFAVGTESLAARNGLSRTRRLVAGKRLHVDNRHIVPKTLPNGILINLPQRLLFYFVGGRLESWYPVALGQSGRWPT